MKIDIREIIELDDELISQGCPIRNRSMKIAAELSKKHKSTLTLGGEFHKSIEGAFKTLYPDYGKRFETIECGIATFLDQVYPVKIPIIHGTVDIKILELIDISEKYLKSYCHRNPKFIDFAIFCARDTFDFFHGCANFGGANEDRDTLFLNASHHLTSLAPSLRAQMQSASVVQSACIAVELSLKGALSHHGIKKE